MPEKKERKYIAIDLKSFYASVECVERGLNPLDSCLVVADASRTQKTICLAVSPALKAYGIGGRPRLFEVISKVKEVNKKRGKNGKSASAIVLNQNADIALTFYVAAPRMGLYIDYSSRIYEIYLKYIAPEDMHIYSIDEVFIDATDYMDIYGLTAHELALTIIRDILAQTGITATAGIGTNLYLCKVAMDIVAKKMAPDKDGVRIAELDDKSYRKELWSHVPITDFWRVGRGTAHRLALYGIKTMGDLARFSLKSEDILYKLFGINAELLIDHAWGWEPVRMKHIKAYRPENRSISSGQVLHCAYSSIMARNVIMEMADSIALELTEKHLVTDQVVLTVGYDAESLSNPCIRAQYKGGISIDFYGRQIPKHSHGTINLGRYTASGKLLVEKIVELYDRIINPILLIRRLTLAINHLVPDTSPATTPAPMQLDIFSDYENIVKIREAENLEYKKERDRQQAIVRIKHTFGKNAILKGLNFSEGATQKDRNRQIGGHHE